LGKYVLGQGTHVNQMDDLFSIRNTTKGKLPSLPFHQIKDTVLGKKYSLSLVFIGDRRSKILNKEHKGKNAPTNILSFPLSKKEGEIFITPSVAEKQAPKFGKTKKQMIGYLLIHGLLHLNGMRHGSKMEQAEKKFCKKFNF